MRVLLTTDTVGGVWTFTKELTEQYLKMGHSVALMSFGRLPSHEQQSWCVQMRAEHGDSFFHDGSDAPLEWMQNNATAYEQGTSSIIKLAKKFSPDIVHSNQFCFGRLPLGLPTLVTAHSDVLSWADACKPNGLEPSPWLHCYMNIVQQGLESADLVTAPTAWMRQELCRHFYVPCRIDVILNGISLAPASDKHSDAPRAVSVGRIWDEAKGLSTLTQIASPMPILIAGEDSFGDASQELMQSNVKFLGRLTQEQLVVLFRQSHVYLATSLYEPFGLAPLEAALCGCAIIARDLPSFREVWADAAAYFTDTTSLERLLNILAKDGKALQLMQTAAMSRAKQFTAARMAEQYLNSYKNLLRNTGTTQTAAAEDKFVWTAA
jgi:glycogen synthase